MNFSLRRLIQFLGILILIIFLYTVDFNQLFHSMKDIQFIWIPVLILFWMLNILIKGVIWKILVKALNATTISYKFALLSVLAGISSGSIAPGRADIAKPLMLKTKYNVPISMGVSSMFIERIFYLLSLIFLFSISSLFFIDKITTINIVLFPILSIFIIFVMLLLRFPQKIFEVIEKIVKIIPLSKNIRNQILNAFQSFLLSIKLVNKRILVIVFIFSLFAMIVEVLWMYCVFIALDIGIPLQLLAFSFFASVLFSLITMIPGGVGVYETSQSVIIHNVDSSIGFNTIKSGVLLYRMFYYLDVLIGGIILLTYSHLKNSDLSEDHNESNSNNKGG